MDGIKGGAPDEHDEKGNAAEHEDGVADGQLGVHHGLAIGCQESRVFLRAKGFFVELRKGLGKAAARRVGRGQSLHRLRRAQQRPRLIHQRRNRLIQQNTANRLRCLRKRGKNQRTQFPLARNEAITRVQQESKQETFRVSMSGDSRFRLGRNR